MTREATRIRVMRHDPNRRHPRWRRATVPSLLLVAALLGAAGCDSTRGQVTVWTKRGDAVTGVLERSDATTLVIRDATGALHEIRRADVATLAAVGAAPVPAASAPTAGPARKAARRTVVVAAGTSLSVTLTTALASATARMGDAIEATLAEPLVIEGVELAPTGARFTGRVTDARRAASDGTPARLVLQFDRLQLGTGTVLEIGTAAILRQGRIVQRGNRVVDKVGSIIGRRPKGTAVDFALGAGIPLEIALSAPLTIEVAGTP